MLREEHLNTNRCLFADSIIALTIVNTFGIVAGEGSSLAGGALSDKIRDHSKFDDVVDLTSNIPDNLHSRMMVGADVAPLSDANIGEFSSKVNGDHWEWFFVKPGKTARDFVIGSCADDALDLSLSLTGGRLAE